MSLEKPQVPPSTNSNNTKNIKINKGMGLRINSSKAPSLHTLVSVLTSNLAHKTCPVAWDMATLG